MAKGWPKGVSRKQHNIDKESAINPFQAQEVSERTSQDDGSVNGGPQPHLVENSAKFQPFTDRLGAMDEYLQSMGLDSKEPESTPAISEPEVPPPSEADTGGERQPSETIEVKKDEPVMASETTTSTPVQQQEAIPESTILGESRKYKHKNQEEAEKAANEAERKMHEATTERSRIESEKKTLEAFNKQMMEVLRAIKTSQTQPQAQPKPEPIELTPEQKTELIINNPDEFERIVTEKAKREIFQEIELRQKRDQEEIGAASRQRANELFIRMGEQHLDTTYPEMKIYGPFVLEETEKILKSPGARELISQKGPQGLIDQAVVNTKARIEQIIAFKQAESTPHRTPANSGEIRTPIPASPVVKPSGMIPGPAPEVPPTMSQIHEDSMKARELWKSTRGLG